MLKKAWEREHAAIAPAMVEHAWVIPGLPLSQLTLKASDTLCLENIRHKDFLIRSRKPRESSCLFSFDDDDEETCKM